MECFNDEDDDKNVSQLRDIKVWGEGKERDRQTDRRINRQTDKQRERERERERERLRNGILHIVILLS